MIDLSKLSRPELESMVTELYARAGALTAERDKLTVQLDRCVRTLQGKENELAVVTAEYTKLQRLVTYLKRQES